MNIRKLYNASMDSIARTASKAKVREPQKLDLTKLSPESIEILRQLLAAAEECSATTEEERNA